MRGAKIQYTSLGNLLKDAREKMGMSLESASSVIGLTNQFYLWRCENGRSNFPLLKLKRAAELYQIKPEQVLRATIDDYTKGMAKALGVK